MTSSGSSFASDSTINTALSVPATTRSSCDDSICVSCRVQHVVTVDITDAGCTHRAAERQAGNGHRGRGADQRGDIGIDLRVIGNDREDHLYFVGETFREQRAQRAINQATQQCFRFAGASFATEEVAGYLAGGIALFLVINCHREEVASFHGLLVTDNRCKHLCLAHADNDRTALAGDFPGF